MEGGSLVKGPFIVLVPEILLERKWKSTVSSWVIGIKFGLYIGTTHKRYRNYDWHLTVL